MHREYCNSFNKTVSIFQPLEEMEELKTQLLAKKCWASHSGSEWTMNISIHCHQMYTFKEWRNWIQTEVWNFNLQVTVNLNELNFSFLCLQVLREVHCIKSKVKCWVGKPNTLKQGFDVEEVCQWEDLSWESILHTQALDVLDHIHLQTYNNVMKSRNSWSVECRLMSVMMCLCSSK